MSVIPIKQASHIPKQIAKQSLFFAYCPDKPNILSKRLEVRAEHFARVQVEKKDGKFFFGIGYLPPPDSSLFTHPSLSQNQQPMAGSIMMYRMPNKQGMWDRIKDDIYWKAGVWDPEQVKVEELIKYPDYVDME